MSGTWLDVAPRTDIKKKCFNKVEVRVQNTKKRSKLSYQHY
jgi:hypothetical protein